MKCLDSGTLQAYIDGELSPQMMTCVMKHLDQCAACQRQFETILAMDEWEETLKAEETPPLMLDMQVAWEKVEKKTTQKNRISRLKGVFSEMKNTKKWMTVAATALLVVTGVPVVASGIYNLFTEHVLEDDVVNKGMTNEKGETIDGTKNGVFHTLDEQITDQGITVHLTDLYVSESRVSVHYTIEDEAGNLVPVTYNTEGLDIKSDGTQMEGPEYWLDREAGTFSTLQFLACEDNLPFELMKDGKPYHTGVRELGDKNDATVTFAAMEAIDYPVVLDIAIDQIGGVKGEWKAQIELSGNEAQ
ncbi:MAG: DUF4179 domain-containing protein [Cellulosilyticaceae bacterium]